MSTTEAATLGSARLTSRVPNGVLVAEDDPMFRRILQGWLESWGDRVHIAHDGTQAWQILDQECSPELLILDWMMPGIDGLELCRRIRAGQRATYRYILLITARDERSDVLEGLEAGADDYLTKPFTKAELQARLTVGRRILRLQDDLIHAREDLRFQATHDGLTGAWNRDAVIGLLRREMERASRSQSHTSLLLLDLDHFKKVNDTYGHPAGDAVLKEIVLRISQVIRSYDLLGRYGGEEFAVVLPNCNHEQAVQSAERIRAAVCESPVRAGEVLIPITVSIGAAMASSGTSDADLLAQADGALYRAKHAGRNRVAV